MSSYLNTSLHFLHLKVCLLSRESLPETENERFIDSRSDTITGQRFIIYQSSSIDELDRVPTRYCNDGKDEIPCELIDSFTTKNPSFLFKQIESFRYVSFYAAYAKQFLSVKETFSCAGPKLCERELYLKNHH